MSQYNALLQALQRTSIPFAENEWTTRPEGNYGVVSLDMESGSLDADGLKQDRKWEASVDVFFYLLSDRAEIVSTVESILREICGSAWEMNSAQHESETGLFHIEWTCEVMDDGSDDEN